MKRIVIGILAHVDCGKTTLSEAMLYAAGEISKRGRVDKKDSFLDNNEIERDRGITIFSKQAQINFEDTEITLLDTPGHVDFGAEAERTLGVLDYAILIISATDGVQSHTQTLWRLLEHYKVPVFIFINKMDLPSSSRSELMGEIKKELSEACVDYSAESFAEEAAFCSEELFDEYEETGKVNSGSIINAVLSRRMFMCFFGSALLAEGTEEFFSAIRKYTVQRCTADEFGARVFKIAADERGRRLTYMKITGGRLKVKEELKGADWAEKADEIRVYSGAKYKSTQEVFAGSVCAVLGLSKTYPGEGLGFERGTKESVLEPVFSYEVQLPEGADVHAALAIFRRVEEEDPQLKVFWNELNQCIQVRLMGEVQMEVLKRILYDRYGLEADFKRGRVIYKETIESTAEGVGHYEPLRHYAEVHLLLEPGKNGSGVVFKTNCSEDILERRWQRLILTHLAEKTHIGVLTGSPITDIKITLVNGRAHKKHTEGGDFRQATYRAVRNGLMHAKSVILEPWYDFRLSVPVNNAGRAMTDLEQMGADFEPPAVEGEISVITGSAPVCGISEYQKSVTAYSGGRGRIMCSYSGYRPAKDQEKIIESIGYDCESDVENTADSVFCAHGSGFIVKWDKVYDYMHIPLYEKEPKAEAVTQMPRQAARQIADEEELLRIFEKTYGKVQIRNPKPMRSYSKPSSSFKAKPLPQGPEYLLIDGYNIIFASDELKKAAEESLDDARRLLTQRICNYQAMRENNVILVFDAYKVKGVERETEKIHGISVVYTKEAETADAYIEKVTKQLTSKHRVRVATSDNLEQMIIFGHGAKRVTANELMEEVRTAEEEIRNLIHKNNLDNGWKE